MRRTSVHCAYLIHIFQELISLFSCPPGRQDRLVAQLRPRRTVMTRDRLDLDPSRAAPDAPDSCRPSPAARGKPTAASTGRGDPPSRTGAPEPPPRDVCASLRE